MGRLRQHVVKEYSIRTLERIVLRNRYTTGYPDPNPFAFARNRVNGYSDRSGRNQSILNDFIVEISRKYGGFGALRMGYILWGVEI